MKFKTKVYELKRSVAPGAKTKKLKSTNSKINDKVKYIGGIKDNRKYANDNTLSEAEKISRRMALENMKRKGNNNNKPKNKLFFKDNDNDDAWENDPFLLKAKQINGLDEGLDESSEGEPNEDDTDKYFANDLLPGKKEKKTLGDKIRESKIEKYEKNKINAENVDATIKANEIFRNEIRFILPKLAAFAKTKSNKDYKAGKADYGTMFQNNFETLIYAPRPQKVDDKTIHVKSTEKDNDKMVNMKIKRLREHLIKDGVVKDEDCEEEDVQSNDESEEDCEEEEEEFNSEDDEDEDENVSAVESEQDEEDEEEDEEEDDSDKDSKEDDDSVDVDTDPGEAFKNLKKIITNTSKATKRKLDDNKGNDDIKKLKTDESKNEVDCLRVILQMPDLRKDAMCVLANEMNTVDITEDDFKRKLILATLFQETLKTNDSNCYSPELVGLLKFLCENATSESNSWLSVKSNLSNISENDRNDICDDSKTDIGKQALSTLFHVLSLLISVINCNKELENRHSLFLPLLDIFDKFPKQFYPSWLLDKLQEVVSLVNNIRSEPVPVLRMKKNIKIIELLEPELEDKYDPAKNLTKSLKDKVKKERKSVKKALKLNAQERLINEVNESRKISKFRSDKTKEIMNTAHQII